MTLLIQPEKEDILHLPNQHVFFRVYKNPNAKRHRHLLLLHGGGVAGQITWEGIIQSLDQWSEILVPDLRGAGLTHYPDHQEHQFEVEEVVEDIVALLAHFGWNYFDLGGYSFGGLVAMLLKMKLGEKVQKTYLMEPAILSRTTQKDAIKSRERLVNSLHLMRDPATVEEGLTVFLDSVAPRRTRGSRSEQLMRERLSHRPAGLAAAIFSIASIGKRVERSELIAAQAHVSSFIGERSNPEIYQLCQHIAAGRTDWICHLMQGTDHAMPLQKPQAIAHCFNQDLQRYLEQTN